MCRVDVFYVARTTQTAPCTNPSRAIRSLAYGTRVSTKASNNIRKKIMGGFHFTIAELLLKISIFCVGGKTLVVP